MESELKSIVATTGLISSRKPDGLILSTGNLYFTSHDGAGAAVWRMAQSEIPDQESVLYWEAGGRFGDIVFAEVNGNFFGYFFAESAAGITIKRIPLEGGNATVLATIGTDIDIANSHRNLITDGVHLYWQDVNSVRKMPVGGGPITVLDQTASNTPTAGLVLQHSNIIYASVADIRFVPSLGAVTSPTVRTIAYCIKSSYSALCRCHRRLLGRTRWRNSAEGRSNHHDARHRSRALSRRRFR